ncbi:MAG TPA: Ig-like domain-containing protein, partial [Myxococcaceae bacterium]
TRTYTPDAHYNGPDSFTFTVSDGSATSAPATVSLTITPANDAPVATAQALTTPEDTPLQLTLTGTDRDGDSLTFTLGTPPAHGTLSGTAPHLTYTPEQNFHGSDSLTFEVSDGVATSSATVSITVSPVNDAPVASNQALSVGMEPLEITLSATDVDGDTLSFSIQSPPTEGTLRGTPPQVTYTPPTGFRGTTSFTFTASDGQASSAPATVTLTVGNTAPSVALSASTLRPLEGEGVRFQSSAADANMDPLTFHWDFGDGASSQEPSPIHAYANEGTFEVVLTVSDGFDTVQERLTLEVQNAAPVLVPLEAPAMAEEGKPLVLRAEASDPGAGDTLSFSWDFGDGSAPALGAEVTHTYADDGTYTAKVTVTDNAGAFVQAVREVQVSNLPPVPEQVASRTLQGGERVEIQLKATDAAGARDPLTWSLVEGPGTVSASGLFQWQSEPASQGDFVIRARVADDEEGTADVLFTLSVTPTAEPPPDSTPDSGCGCASGAQGTASSFFLLLMLAVLTQRRARS